ncbi:MAG: hypothetical protein LBD97_08115 [Bifidobacteriaceae bacterium]|nr:hypothetical protein [Bifidobacteriaceae bacterium]
MFLIGHPLDLDHPERGPDRIAAQLAAADSVDALIREAAYLGGRWVVLAWDGAQLVAVPDCAATMPAYWSKRPFVLASHLHLVAELAQLERDEGSMNLMARARSLGARGTLHWPGIKTPFLGVAPLLPNHHLTWDGQEGRHVRFYPFDDTTLERDVDRAYKQFRELFVAHVQAICRAGEPNAIGVSLTAGVDSRASLAAALSWRPTNLIAFTFVRQTEMPPGLLDDLLGANAVAVANRVFHRVVVLDDRTDTAFNAAYRRTFRHTPQFRGVAQSYYYQLPDTLIELQSMISAAGSGASYRNRGEPLSSARLARLYSNSEYGRTAEVGEALAEFAEYADLTDEARLGPIDYHDAFYWEHRLGRWATLRMQEVDLAHLMMLPYNSRGVIEALQGPPLEERAGKQAQRRFIAESGILRPPGWAAPARCG